VSEWREVALGELIDVSHGYAFKGEYFGEGGDTRLVTPGNFFEGGGFRDRGPKQKSYDGPVPEEYILDPGEIVVAMTEQAHGLLGSSGLVPSTGTWLHNQRIGRVHFRDRSTSRRFVYYLFNTPGVRAQVAATATGAKVRHTAPERILAVKVVVPHPRTQARIGAALSSFDELIEINERQIWLLEDLSRSLYAEWFLQFRYPGHSNLPAAEDRNRFVPPGWSELRVADLAEVVSEGISPSDIASDSRYCGLEDLPRRATTLREWDTADVVTSRKLRFQECDTLFGKIRPYFHKVVWAPFSGIASSDTIIFRPRHDRPAPALVNAILSSDALVAEAVATSNGTKMPRADPRALLTYRVVLPALDSALMRQAESALRAARDRCAALVSQNMTLARTRDLLLPRLVTGRLDISDVHVGDLLPDEDAK
jgi:type I restriction enzyme S subunit